MAARSAALVVSGTVMTTFCPDFCPLLAILMAKRSVFWLGGYPFGHFWPPFGHGGLDKSLEAVSIVYKRIYKLIIYLLSLLPATPLAPRVRVCVGGGLLDKSAKALLD